MSLEFETVGNLINKYNDKGKVFDFTVLLDSGLVMCKIVENVCYKIYYKDSNGIFQLIHAIHDDSNIVVEINSEKINIMCNVDFVGILIQWMLTE